MLRALASLDRTGESHALPELEWVCAGWAWPRDLGARLDDALAQGRPVIVDLRKGAWSPSQLAEQRGLAAWLTTRAARDDLVVWR